MNQQSNNQTSKKFTDGVRSVKDSVKNFASNHRAKLSLAVGVAVGVAGVYATNAAMARRTQQ